MTGDEHPLVQFAAGMPRQPATNPDGDLLYQVGRTRAELGGLAEAMALGRARAGDFSRMAELLRDVAQVLDVQAGTEQHREALTNGTVEDV